MRFLATLYELYSMNCKENKYSVYNSIVYIILSLTHTNTYL